MSGKHVKVRACRRGGGTPVRTVVLGGAAWVSISAVLAVAAPSDPAGEPGADPALPSPSALPEDPARDPLATRTTDRGREARVLASPSADARRPSGDRSLLDGLADQGEGAAGTALSAAADATSSGPALSTGPAPDDEPESDPDSAGPRPSDGGDPESSDPEPSEAPEQPEDDDEDEPADDPVPSLELPAVPTVPSVGLP